MAKTEAIKAISFSGRTVTLTKTDNTTSTVANTYALYSEVWDTDGHLIYPAGWKFYITNELYYAVTNVFNTLYTTPGTYTYTVPEGVTQLTVVVIGFSYGR